MFNLQRTDVPVISIGMIDDSSFTDISHWGALFRMAYRTARSAGAPLRGRVRIAANMVDHVMGSAVTLDVAVQLLTTLSGEYDGLELWADQSLAPDVVILD